MNEYLTKLQDFRKRIASHLCLSKTAKLFYKTIEKLDDLEIKDVNLVALLVM